ncbi:MAG: CHAT domain-containing protein [Anaerolineae bacterium]
MTTDSEVPVTPQWVSALLALPSTAEQQAFLQGGNRYDAAGLTALISFARRTAPQNPDTAAQITTLAITIAQTVDPTLIPQATYVRAQTHALRGQFATAQSLIQSAHDGYLANGQTAAALRTQIGLMHVLGELGQYDTAIETGQTLITRISQNSFSPEESGFLTALAQQNLGICLRRTGQYEDALTAYREAESHFTQMGRTAEMGQLQMNQGLVLINLGRVREAVPVLETAVSTFSTAVNTHMQAKALNNLAIAQQMLGHFNDALNTFEQSRRLFATLSADGVEQHILLLDTADLYRSLNLYVEAAGTYQEAAAAFENTGMTHYLARTRWGLGLVRQAQSQSIEAEALFSEAINTFAAAKNAPLQADVLLEQAALFARRKDRSTALQQTRQALGLVADSEWLVQQAYAQMRLADLLLPDTEEADQWLQKAAETINKLALPHLRYRLNQRWGRLRVLQNRDAEAEQLLRSAIEEIEQLRGTLPQETTRASFLQDKVVAYEDLVQLYLNRGDAAGLQQAFSVTEQAKSRALVDLLTGLTQTKLDTAVDPAAAARLQVLQADLNALYSEAFNGSSGGERAIYANLHQRAETIEHEISRLRLQTIHHPQTATTLTQPLSTNDIANQLPAQTTLLAYYVINDEITVFVQQKNHLQVVRNITTIPTVTKLTQRLMMQWGRFRVGETFTNRHMNQLVLSARRVLAELYNELMAPVAHLLPAGEDGQHRLTIIPHSVLHQMPFHALFDGEQYLLDRYDVSYAPSATIFTICQQRPSPPYTRSLIMGVADAHIPFVATEVDTVAQHAPNTAVFLNDSATLNRLKQHAPHNDLIHLACHGLFRHDNPMFSALKLADGWLTAGDVMQLRLDGALVTLSACESGRSRLLAGDEIMGLTRAFLSAGVSTLVVSLWLVEDKTTATLMADWYQRLRQDNGRSASLRAAQLALKEKYPHPYYWAPFILVGRS